MLGEFISRGLLMILGYAYPAIECFKTVEKNKANIHELRFWCQYWIIIAIISIGERFGDVLISWVPMYGELKLAFIIYLWYPKTKGTSYVYENLLRPFVSKHETDIDKNLQELRLRLWDLAIYYYHNCTELGQSAIFNVIQYVANQSSRLKGNTSKESDRKNKRRGSPPPDLQVGSPRQWPPTVQQPTPSAPPLPSKFPSLFKAEAQASKPNVVQMELDEAQTEYVHIGVAHEQDCMGPPKEKSKFSLFFRRPKPTH